MPPAPIAHGPAHPVAVILFFVLSAFPLACSSGGGGGGGVGEGGSGAGPGTAAHGTIVCGSTPSCDLGENVCCATGSPTCAGSCSNGGFDCLDSTMCSGGSVCCTNGYESACRTTCGPGESTTCDPSSSTACGDGGLLCGTLIFAGLGPGHIEYCQP